MKKKIFILLVFCINSLLSFGQVRSKCVNINATPNCPLTFCIEESIYCPSNGCICECNDPHSSPTVDCSGCSGGEVCFHYMGTDCSCCDCTISYTITVTNCETNETITVSSSVVPYLIAYLVGTYSPPSGSIYLGSFVMPSSYCGGLNGVEIVFNGSTFDLLYQ